jgi:hypothetical protein
VRKKLFNKIEAIVLHLCFRRFRKNIIVLKLISQVITDVRPKGIPQCPWLSRRAVT